MKNIILNCLVVLVLFGCTKEEPLTTDSCADVMTSFSFSTMQNNIDVNSTATIDKEVDIFLPPGTELTELVPEFTLSPNSLAFIDDREIVSGMSSIDFSENVNFEISSNSTSTITCLIRVTTEFISLNEKIEEMMLRYQVPGMQLAISKNEKLVYAKSFGLADTLNKKKVNEKSLFRIASISKPITAVAILKLVEDGMLKLDDKVFGEGALLENEFGTPPYASDKTQITVKHLLEHTSGWTNYPYDPMFDNLELSKSDLIDYMLDDRALQYYPGNVYDYLNFGYCVLGRIIEKITNLTYEEYVRTSMLVPIGIDDMHVGKNIQLDKYENEVTYYAQENSSPYNINIERLDAAGGWISSSTDLVKFLAHIDRKSYKPDLLNASSLNNMFFGNINWYFFGSLSGTSSCISRYNNNSGYAIIANTRITTSDNMLGDMRFIMDEELNLRSSWPTYDLMD